jgi:hypothetical protein
LAPETPSRLRSGGKSGKKTDGVHVVGESPEVKQEGKYLFLLFSFFKYLISNIVFQLSDVALGD